MPNHSLLIRSTFQQFWTVRVHVAGKRMAEYEFSSILLGEIWKKRKYVLQEVPFLHYHQMLWISELSLQGQLVISQLEARHRRHHIFKFNTETKTLEAFISILRLRHEYQNFRSWDWDMEIKIFDTDTETETWKSQFSILRLIPESLMILRLLLHRATTF